MMIHAEIGCLHAIHFLYDTQDREKERGLPLVARHSLCTVWFTPLQAIHSSSPVAKSDATDAEGR
jgi:hypothetical protein